MATEAGKKATEDYYRGMSPLAYLLAEGWRVCSVPDADDPHQVSGIIEGWTEVCLLDPAYGQHRSMNEAKAYQLDSIAERLGGYERLRTLVNEHGVDLDELEH